jgi:small subunit ribosomal protein S8
MNHTDPIADMLTRIRNAIMAEHKSVAIPLSRTKREIAKVLKREGYITDFRVEKSKFPPHIHIDLKYKGPKENVIEGIKRISKPGRRVYAGVENLPKVLGGLGVAVLSTSRGILTGKDCEKFNMGGEVLLYVW